MKLLDSIDRQPVAVAFGMRRAGGLELTVQRDADAVSLTSDQGGGASIPSATYTEAGVLSASDKQKLDSVSGTTEYESLQAAAQASPDPATDYLRTAGYHEPGDSGGGLYVRVASEPGHSGKLRTADGAWWELTAERGWVTPQQFGAVGDNVTDDSAAFQAAVDFARHFAAGGSFYPATYGIEVPPVASGYYLGTTTLSIKARVHIRGQSSGMQSGQSARLRWGAQTTGIQVHRYNTVGATTESPTTTGGDGSILEGLDLVGGRGTIAGVTDRTRGHGIDLRARALIRNCQITDFAGNGVNIVASAGVGGEIEGNANCWRIEGGVALRCGLSGVYADGADVNSGCAIGLDATANGRWGIWDSSFLGNTYIGIHTATNGVAGVALNASDQSSFVHHAGVRYSAHPGASPADLVATTPGTNANVWVPMVAGGQHLSIPTWAAGQPEGTYFHGGAYHADNPNAANLFLGCYAESGQGGTALGMTSNMAVGGSIYSAGFITGDHYRSRFGIMSGRGFDALGSNLTACRLGGDDGNGDVLKFAHVDDNPGWPWRLRRSGADFVLENANVGSRTAFRITGEKTTMQMGSSATQPYLMNVPTLALGPGANARRQTTGTAAPTTGAWAKGDVVWNIAAAAGGKVGWICTSAGSPGTWKPFGAIDA